METEQSIAPALFKNASLLDFQFPQWSGMTTPKDADLEITGVTNVDSDFFKKGTIQLIDKEAMQPFVQLKNRCVHLLDHLMDAPIGRTKFVNNDDFRERIRPALVKAREEFSQMLEIFCSVTYPQNRQARIDRFNQAHPEWSGRLDDYFPSTQEIREKFDFSWGLVKISDVDALDAVMAEEASEMREKMKSFAVDLAANFRKSAVQAALAFRRGIDRAKNQVDSRAVGAFRDFLGRLDREDFLGDVQMKELLNSMKARVFSVDQWRVDDQSSMEEIRRYLDEVVTLGQNEGDAAAVAVNYIRRVSSEETVGEISMETQISLDRETEHPSVSSHPSDPLMSPSLERMG